MAKSSASSAGTCASRWTCARSSRASSTGRASRSSRPRSGPTMVCGWASIHGYPSAWWATMGSSTRGRPRRPTVIEPSNQVDVPLVFVRTSPGTWWGAGRGDGIIKKGSQMLNAVTNSTVPHLTPDRGPSYGADTYGMSGRAFGNRFTFLWPTAKIRRDGPEQIAGVTARSAARRPSARARPSTRRRTPRSSPPWRRPRSVGRWPSPPPGRSATRRHRPRTRARCSGWPVGRAQPPVEGATGYGVFRL